MSKPPLARVGVWLYLTSFLLPAIAFPGGSILKGYTCAWLVLKALANPEAPGQYLLVIFLNLANLLTLWVILARGRTGRLSPGLLLSLAWLSSLYWTVMPWNDAFPDGGVPHLMVGWFAWMAAIGLLALAHTGPRAAPAPKA